MVPSPCHSRCLHRCIKVCGRILTTHIAQLVFVHPNRSSPFQEHWDNSNAGETCVHNAAEWQTAAADVQAQLHGVSLSQVHAAAASHMPLKPVQHDAPCASNTLLG